MIHIFGIAVVLAYLAASLFYARALRPESRVESRPRVLLLLGLAGHIIFLSFFYSETLTGAAAEGPAAIWSTPTTLSLIAWLLVASFLLLERRLRLSVLGVFVAPLAALLALSSGLLFHLPRDERMLTAQGPWFVLHLVGTILAHGAFALAFVVSIGVILKEYFLKVKRFPVVQQRLPALETLDRLSGRLIAGGFALMVLGVVTGMYFGFQQGIEMFILDPRLLCSFLTLIVYGAVLTARHKHGWRGRRAAWLAIAGFATIVLSFVSLSSFGGSFHVF